MKNAYSKMVRPYEKSVVMGGVISLFPVESALTREFARNIVMAMERAENNAYECGIRDAQAAFRKSIGI